MKGIDKPSDDSQEIETPLTGGGRTAVSRKGQVVFREAGPWVSTVHALLKHLERIGFPGSPRVVGSGFDSQGRETLTFIDGEFVHPGPWSEQAFFNIGQLIRDLHRATASFSVPEKAIWREWHGRHLGNPSLSIGHCDTGPWNIVSRDGLPYALIDWEVAGPVDPLTELAQCCWLNAQLHDDDVAESVGLPSLHDRAHHARYILDGYELPNSQRVGFVERMIEFAVHDAAIQAIEGKVTPESRDATPLWGITWRTRSASWMLRRKAILERGIVGRSLP
ncbi:phosphotransferase [Candidatus Eisenbacteria bacterium]|uniref:Phosphotransferase n=1 Tax=Eiseniibacteriota bacterium TaxID=2212470 RepID=A0ABV6YJ25_UNCEI